MVSHDANFLLLVDFMYLPYATCFQKCVSRYRNPTLHLVCFINVDTRCRPISQSVCHISVLKLIAVILSRKYYSIQISLFSVLDTTLILCMDNVILNKKIGYTCVHIICNDIGYKQCLTGRAFARIPHPNSFYSH